MRRTYRDRAGSRVGGEVGGKWAKGSVALAVVVLTQTACISVPVRIKIQHLPDLDGLGTVANRRWTISEAGRPIAVDRASVLRVRSDTGAAFTSRFRSISVTPWGFVGLPEGGDPLVQIAATRLQSIEVWRVSRGWTFLTVASIAATVALTVLGAFVLYVSAACEGRGRCLAYY